MGLFEKLSEDEKEMMEQYIDSYASFNGSNRSASLEWIMRVWNEQKETLFHMFGDQFILSKDIIYTKDIDQISEDLDHAIFDGDIPFEDKEFSNEYYNFIDNNFHPWDSDKDWDICQNLRRLINTEDLSTNIYSGASFELHPAGWDKPLKINSGCKCTRALGKIAAAYNLPGFERFRILHSQCLNQKKLTGHLCLSIHPLDFMTMSDNDCGWTSCMSWQEDGCYRQGTVEMMNSPMVVVAYLTAETDMRMPGNYHWNSKKWRQLFVVDPHMIGNVKGYPYRNDYLTKDILAWLKELAENAGMAHYDKNVVEYDSFTAFDYKDRSVKIYPRTGMMYNDFASNQFAYLNENLGEDGETFYLDYSGDSECMLCGDTQCDFEGEGCLVGTCCEARYYCDCCESYYDSEDGFQEVDGSWICPDCFAEQCAEDPFTGVYHFSDNLRELYVSFDGGKTIRAIPDVAVFDDEIYSTPDQQTFFYPYFSQVYEARVLWRRYLFVKAEEVNWDNILKHITTSFESFDELKAEIDGYSHHVALPKDTEINPIFQNQCHCQPQKVAQA